MTNAVNQNAEKYQKVHRRNSIWHRVISILSAITVFITTYAMILPAITMEPSPGLKVQRSFRYEDDQILMVFHVDGRAVFEKESDAKNDLSQDRISLEVTPLEEESSVYEAYVAYARENISEDDLHGLLTMRLNFTYDGAPLDMRGCQIDVEIAAKTQMLEQASQKLAAEKKNPLLGTLTLPQMAVSKEETMAITAFQGVSKDISQQDTGYQSSDGEVLSVNTSLNGSTLAVVMYSTVNPGFTVQYYSHFTVFNDTGDISIDVINTDDVGLPSNGTTPSTKPVYLNQVGNSNRYVMATHLELAPLYTEKTFSYVQAPSIVYMDRLRDNGNYELSQVWVLKAGRRADSTDEADWTIYPNTVSFTNRAESANVNRIYLTDGTILRFVYTEHTGTYTNADVTFFDYDITDGDIHNANGSTYATSKQDDGVWYAKSYLQGINNFTATSGTVRFGYGNSNTGSGLGAETWNGNTLNQYNRSSYKGCTFGMVTGFNADGSLKFASGISAPNMFGTAAANGKTEITDKTLEFIRVGDTYVLNAVGNTDTTNLRYFNNPTYVNASGNTVLHSHIFTNNFWPMDSAWTWGADGHDLVFGDAKLVANRRFFQNASDLSGGSTFPVGDDGLDHNSYFGMKYEIKFTLSEDYMGPLEYMFYGDDDMWVFLDGKLVCDIGGVHSSVGQYVDLWDYLVKGEDHSEHTLTFYYTERGASGSTCYMQFTLPSVDTETPPVETSTLEVSKEVLNIKTDQEFDFEILLTDADGNPLIDDYSYTRYDVNGDVVESGIINNATIIKLRHNEKIVINYLPKGTQFSVREIPTDGYHPSHNVNEGATEDSGTATGTMEESLKIHFVNSASAKLPDTGGSGLALYALPMGLGFAFLLAMPLLSRAWKKRRAA